MKVELLSLSKNPSQHFCSEVVDVTVGQLLFSLELTEVGQ
jgi:hypothetical protein